MAKYITVPSFPAYRIGSDGSVWSRLKRKGLGSGNGSTFVIGDAWRRLKGSKGKDGYTFVKLRRGRTTLRSQLGRLVLTVFRGPCPSGHECCHRNGVRTDNRLRNLYWGTSEENQADRVRHGTLPRGESVKKSKLTDAIVLEIVDPKNRDVSHADLGRRFGVTKECVGYVRNGHTWRHVTGRSPSTREDKNGEVA